MKKLSLKFIAIVALLLMSLTEVNSQIYLNLEGVVQKKMKTSEGEFIEKGETIYLEEIQRSSEKNLSVKFIATVNGNRHIISYGLIDRIAFASQNSIDDFWSKTIIEETDLFERLLTDGMNYVLRTKADKESIELIDRYNDYNLIYKDSYLEECLQSMLTSIHSVTLKDSRPGNLSIKVNLNNSPQAFVLPNGTIMISTGMLSLIDSEEELTAILAHEIAHFVLDHYVENIIKIAKKKKNAEFWAGMAIVAAATGDAYMATQDPYHPYGVITASTIILASAVVNDIIAQLGLKFSRKQEEQADKMARLLLNHLNISSNALATVFEKLRSYFVSVGDYSQFSSKGKHPSINLRIAEAGTPEPEKFISKSYYLMISNVNTSNAYLEFDNHHFKEANRIIDRNFFANIATEDDYILKAKLIRNLFNDEENMNKALDYLIKGESLNVTERFTLSKEKGLTFIRLNRITEAKIAFENYLKAISDFEGDNMWISNEIEWTKKMIFKCGQI